MRELQKNEKGVYLIVENVEATEQIEDIQEVYLKHDSTIIFKNIPLQFHHLPISKLTYTHPFSNNYISKLLERHPSKTVEMCLHYRNPTYQLYISSLY